MKVHTRQVLDVEIEVSVTVDEITAALREAVAEADDTRQVLRFLESLHQCLAAVPQDLIQQLSPENRRLVIDRFLDQLNRFHNKPTDD
jgi:hypothetical protein